MSAKPMTKKEWLAYLQKAIDEFDWDAAFNGEPKREWVGLTDEEINSVRYKRDWTAPWTDTTFARAIESKLKEKNT
jgi:hypothetical protein